MQAIEGDTVQANQEQKAVGESRELLTFTFGLEEYGIDILKVQEILGYDVVTTIANAPGFIKGVQFTRHDRPNRGHAHQIQTGRGRL